MKELTLNEAEQEVADCLLSWVREFGCLRAAAGRKLLRVITPQHEVQFYTLLSDPVPRLVFHEPVGFAVTVHQAKGECRAGHEVGDRWEFDWRTPAGICGSAYHALYPVLHGLMLTSGRYEGPAARESLVSCPDAGWITFRIVRRAWTPELWEVQP
jgi:uncharacterized repeat protein (TIGR04076 family)